MDDCSKADVSFCQEIKAIFWSVFFLFFLKEFNIIKRTINEILRELHNKKSPERYQAIIQVSWWDQELTIYAEGQESTVDNFLNSTPLAK